MQEGERLTAEPEPGDRVIVKKGKSVYSGIVMPSMASDGDEILTLKLKNGYNIGLLTDEIEVEVVEKGSHPPAEMDKEEFIEGRDGREVLLIGTGGTIASKVEYRTGAVHPALSASELVESVPELKKICSIRTRPVFSILSENIAPSNWLTLAKEVYRAAEEGLDAIVIPHGTDTMAYTASALSFMLRGVGTVLVGAQRSSDRPSTDARLNLLGAVRTALTDIGESVVVMHGESSDTFLNIHRGNRVRKMHTSARNAFKTINGTPLGRVSGEKVEWLRDYRKRGEPEIHAHLEERVGLIQAYPGLTPETLHAFAEKNRGIVIAGTGLGHISSTLIPTVVELIESGMPVVITSQCLYGTTNLNVYETGRDMKAAGVIPVGDMLPETALIKLMWVLGQTDDDERVRELMTTNIAGEIENRRHLGI